MTTWENNSYARTSTGIVTYQRRAGVAIALADPLGPEEGRAESVAEFIGMAERAGLTPCFFSASEATRAAVPRGWRSLVVADDTIVDLPGLEFTGKRWNSVRSSMNRAGREEMTFRMSHLKEESWGIQQQLRAISEMWVGDKGLPEMGFTLGTLTEAEDPEVRLALAISPSGDVDGFLSWLPVYGRDGVVRGWTLDLMRRREGGFPPVMEFLIGMSAAHFRDEGAEIMSLSGAPLAHDYPPDAGMIAELSEKLAEILEPVYGFRSLHRFKEKFNPRYETMYLLFRDEADLTRIAAGLTRAFLPDATLRQFASAGIDMVRSGRD
jgi:phosphatidylglycerol lysyltransferase